MISFDPGHAYDWLQFLWALVGLPIIFVGTKCYKFGKSYMATHHKIAMVVLGDPEMGIKGVKSMIDERADTFSELSEHIQDATKKYEQLQNSVNATGREVRAMREEQAVNDAKIKHLQDTSDARERMIGALQETNQEVRVALQITNHEVKAALQETNAEVREALAAQSRSIDYIQKELTHNGGGSVKDMSRDAARNTQTLLGMFQARDNMAKGAAYFCTDAEGSFTFVSRTYCHWTGYSLEELIDSGWINCVYPDDREAVRDAWESAIEDGRDFDMTYRLWTRLREIVWIESKAQKTSAGWYGRIIKLTPEEIVKFTNN